MYLLIVDRRVALMPAHLDKQGQGHDYLVIHPSALLDSLLAQFQSAWDQASQFEVGATTVALSARHDEVVLSPDESRVLAMLGAGMQDASIAAQLGIGERTVHRQYGASWTCSVPAHGSRWAWRRAGAGCWASRKRAREARTLLRLGAV